MGRSFVDHIFFDGKKFISLRSASKITGYHRDYLGQLIRGKKLEGRIIGSAWFIEEDILHNFFKKPRSEVISRNNEIRKTPLRRYHFKAVILVALSLVLGAFLVFQYPDKAMARFAALEAGLLSRFARIENFFVTNISRVADKFTFRVPDGLSQEIYSVFSEQKDNFKNLEKDFSLGLANSLGNSSYNFKRALTLPSRSISDIFHSAVRLPRLALDYEKKLLGYSFFRPLPENRSLQKYAPQKYAKSIPVFSPRYYLEMASLEFENLWNGISSGFYNLGSRISASANFVLSRFNSGIENIPTGLAALTKKTSADFGREIIRNGFELAASVFGTLKDNVSSLYKKAADFARNILNPEPEQPQLAPLEAPPLTGPAPVSPLPEKESKKLIEESRPPRQKSNYQHYPAD